MFQGLKALIFVGLISLLTTLNIAFTQAASAGNGQTVGGTAQELANECVPSVAQQPDLFSLVGALVNVSRLNSATAQAVLDQANDPITDAMFFTLYCQICVGDLSNECNQIELEAQGFVIPEGGVIGNVNEFVSGNKGKQAAPPVTPPVTPPGPPPGVPGGPPDGVPPGPPDGVPGGGPPSP